MLTDPGELEGTEQNAPNFHARVDIQPMPCPRPRLTRRGSRSHAYLPQRYQDYREHLRQEWALVHRADPLAGPLHLRLAISGRGKIGDLDNYLKAVQDAGNGILWGDDRQIKQLEASFARWGPSNDEPYVEVWVSRLV